MDVEAHQQLANKKQPGLVEFHKEKQNLPEVVSSEDGAVRTREQDPRMRRWM